MTNPVFYPHNTYTVKGIQNGRFSLRFGKSPTGLPEVNTPDDLMIFSDSNGIYIVSSDSDPVQHVIVYDLQGQKRYESASGAKYYPLQRNAASWSIIKVTTKNQVKTVKINH